MTMDQSKTLMIGGMLKEDRLSVGRTFEKRGFVVVS